MGKVAGVDLVSAEVFDGPESRELRCNFGRGKEKLKGFTREANAGGERVMGELLKEWQNGAGLAVVEDDTAPVRQ